MTARTLGRTRTLILLLALLGFGVSSYLTWTHFEEKPVVCAGLGSCATVQASEYATFAGMPVALLGLGLYGAIAAAVLAGARPWALLALFGLALSGMLYSAYLTWVELAVLEAICLWCVVSATIVTAITGLSTPLVLRQSTAAGG